MTPLQAPLASILLLIATLTAQLPAQDPPLPRVMVVAVSRNDAILKGGIGSGSLYPPGKLDFEILAYLTPDGVWKSHPCANSYSKLCDRFAKQYLAKPHQYIVVSNDGRGAKVDAKPTTLSECYDYQTTGDYTGAPVHETAIAADSDEIFAAGTPATHLSPAEEQPILHSLKSLVPTKLDSVRELRFYNVQLEGQSFVVVQRDYQHYESNPKNDTGQASLKWIFAVGAIQNGNFQILYWKKNIEDENEQILGTIRLKSGRDFLITTISDPESQTFHVYGIRDGKLVLIYSGGGSSC
jgi:hypothetical protein